MAGYTRALELDAGGLAALVAPRDDVVLERRRPGTGDAHVLVQEDGPCVRYERRVEPLGGDRYSETVDLALPPGTWRLLLHHALKSSLRRPRPKPGKMPWWAP